MHGTLALGTHEDNEVFEVIKCIDEVAAESHLCFCLAKKLLDWMTHLDCLPFNSGYCPYKG